MIQKNVRLFQIHQPTDLMLISRPIDIRNISPYPSVVSRYFAWRPWSWLHQGGIGNAFRFYPSLRGCVFKDNWDYSGLFLTLFEGRWVSAKRKWLLHTLEQLLSGEHTISPLLIKELPTFCECVLSFLLQATVELHLLDGVVLRSDECNLQLGQDIREEYTKVVLGETGLMLFTDYPAAVL